MVFLARLENCLATAASSLMEFRYAYKGLFCFPALLLGPVAQSSKKLQRIGNDKAASRSNYQASVMTTWLNTICFATRGNGMCQCSTKKFRINGEFPVFTAQQTDGETNVTDRLCVIRSLAFLPSSIPHRCSRIKHFNCISLHIYMSCIFILQAAGPLQPCKC